MPSIALPPPPFSNQNVVACANKLVEKYELRTDARVRRIGFSFWDLFDSVIKPDYGIELDLNASLGVDENGKLILGEYNFGYRRASVNKLLKNGACDGRFIFTLLHEVCGHGVLQQAWVNSLCRSPELLCTDTCTDSEVELSFANNNRWERQANIFAANVGAPIKYVERYAVENLGLHRPVRWLGSGEYFIGKRSNETCVFCDSLDDLCFQIAKRLQCRFSFLSAEAIGYQVRASRIIADIEQGGKLAMGAHDQDAGGPFLRRTALKLQRTA